MKILTIDTATETCGVALTDDTRLVTEFRLNQKKAHNERLVSEIQNLLQESSWHLEDLDGIAFSKGPGSFTGLRIGISVCKGLSYTLDIPMVGVNTLDALAFGIPDWSGEICAVIKAREKEVYRAIYTKFPENFVRCSEYEIVHLQNVESQLNDSTLIVSNPVDLVSNFVKKDSIIAPQEHSFLKPSVIAELGHQKFQGNQTEDPETVEPFYLKDFTPKRKVYYAEP